jgi:hypothetical protein
MDHVVPVEEGVKRSDIHCRLSAICGEKEPESSSMFSWLRSCISGNQTAQKSAKLRSYGESRALETMQTISDLIMTDRRITIVEMQGESDLG